MSDMHDGNDPAESALSWWRFNAHKKSRVLTLISCCA